MKILKSVEFYRKDFEHPWRVSLLVFPDGDMAVELTGPSMDIDKVRLKALTCMDFLMMVNIMQRAVHPDKIKRSVERGWET